MRVRQTPANGNALNGEYRRVRVAPALHRPMPSRGSMQVSCVAETSEVSKQASKPGPTLSSGAYLTNSFGAGRVSKDSTDEEGACRPTPHFMTLAAVLVTLCHASCRCPGAEKSAQLPGSQVRPGC